jgi:tetratricopeptide (TPR) repeat protein
MIGINGEVRISPAALRGGNAMSRALALGAVMLMVMARAGFGQSPPPDDDVALMTRLQEQVMALPEDSREVEGVKILLEHVSEFKDEPTRRRVHLSIAELLAKLGDTEQSLVHFEKAGVSKSRETDPSGSDALSRGRFIDMLVETGKTTDVIQRALAFREGADVSDDDYAELTYAAGRELIILGKVDEGITLGIEAAKSRPCNLAYQYLETLAGDAAIRGHKLAWLETNRWIGKNSGDFGGTERFLSNLAFTEEASGNIDEAIRVLERLTAAYPLSPRAAEQLLRLSFLYSKAGDDAKSRANTARVRDGDYPEEFRVMARRSLDLSSDSGPPSADIDRNGTGSPWRVAMLVLNGLLVLAIVGFMWARRKSASGRRP